jgi:hypothetical protein
MTDTQSKQKFQFNNGNASFYYQGNPNRKRLILGDIPDNTVASTENIPGNNLKDAVSLLAENVGKNSRINLAGHNLIFNTAREGAIIAADTIEGVEAKEGSIIQADEVFLRCVGKNVTICTDNPDKIKLLNLANEPNIVPKDAFNDLAQKRLKQGDYPPSSTNDYKNGFLHVGEVKNYGKLTPKKVKRKTSDREYNDAGCIRTGRIGIGSSVTTPNKYLAFTIACDSTTMDAKAVSGVSAGKGTLIRADSVHLKSIGDNSTICTANPSGVQILEKGTNLRVVSPCQFKELAERKNRRLQKSKSKHDAYQKLTGR